MFTKICPNCKEEFKTKLGQKKFCTSACSGRYYDLNKRGTKNNPRIDYRPKNWRCQKCDYVQKIDFDIKLEWKRWITIKCENCGKPNKD